jgi:molybdenum cofactor cytidylyltransferase
MFTSGILLAAGSATRMGTDKLQLPYNGRRLIDCALEPLANCRLIDEVIVVVRTGFQLRVEETKCRIVVNPDHREGMGSSLRTGVAAASQAADAFVVSLADMPELSVEIVTTLIEAFCRSGKSILVPVYEGRHGHPVVFAASCRPDLLRLGGDLGARSIISEHSDTVEYFPTQHGGVVRDVDTTEDLH